MKSILLATAIALASIVPTHAHIPEHRCGDTTQMIKSLTEKYNEKPIVQGDRGLNTNKTMIFVSEAGTFTVLIVFPGTTSCIAAAGRNFRKVIEEPVGEPT